MFYGGTKRPSQILPIINSLSLAGYLTNISKDAHSWIYASRRHNLVEHKYMFLDQL